MKRPRPVSVPISLARASRLFMTLCTLVEVILIQFAARFFFVILAQTETDFYSGLFTKQKLCNSIGIINSALCRKSERSATIVAGHFITRYQELGKLA